MPAPSSKRVEVDLYLKSNDDLKKLQSALDGFSKNLGGVLPSGTGGGVLINPDASPAGQAAVRARQQAAGGSLFGSPSADPNTQSNQKSALGNLLSLPMSIPKNIAAGLASGNPSQAIMEAAFLPQAAANTFGRLGGLANTIGTGGGFTQYGGNQGFSTAGGITSPAFMAGLQNTAAIYSQAYGIGQPGGTSLGTFFNALRNQNLGDIKQMNAGLSALGWNGSLLNSMVGASSNTQMANIDPQLRADLMNSTRYGTASIAGLSAQFRSMSSDAQAAHMSLNQFSQSVQQVIQSIGGEFGTPQSALANASRGAALGTGLDPSIALSGVNTTTMWMSMAQHSGQANPWLNTFGRAGGIQGAAMISYNMAIRMSGLGNNLNDANAWYKANGRAATLNALWKGYEISKQSGAPWPSSMTPNMLLQLIQRGQGAVQAGFNLNTEIQQAGAHVSQSELAGIAHSAVAALGGTAQAHQDIQNAIATGGGRNAIAQRIQQAVSRANQIQTTKRAQNGTFTIGLDRAAAQALNIQPGDSSTRVQTTKMNGGTAIVYNPSNAPRG